MDEPRALVMAFLGPSPPIISSRRTTSSSPSSPLSPPGEDRRGTPRKDRHRRARCLRANGRRSAGTRPEHGLRRRDARDQERRRRYGGGYPESGEHVAERVQELALGREEEEEEEEEGGGTRDIGSLRDDFLYFSFFFLKAQG